MASVSGSQKHTGKHLYDELVFKNRINENVNKTNKGIAIIRKLSNCFSSPCFINNLSFIY